MSEMVSISLQEDETQDRSRLRTVMHTYNLHPTNNPVQAIAPYNPRRFKTLITAIDVTITLTMDNPTVFPDPTTGSIAPVNNASIILGTTGNGVDGVEVYGPDALWAVAITGNGNCRVVVVQTFWEDDHS